MILAPTVLVADMGGCPTAVDAATSLTRVLVANRYVEYTAVNATVICVERSAVVSSAYC